MLLSLTSKLKNILILGLALVCLSCDSQPISFNVYRIYAMGTWIEISIDTKAKTDNEVIMSEISSFLYQYERDFYPWSNGELRAFNDALTNNKAHIASDDLIELIVVSKKIYTLSEGAFDPSIGRLVELWGFNSMIDNPMTIPQQIEIDEVLANRMKLTDIYINNNNLKGITNKNALLDFGGIAKGQAINHLVEILTTYGVQHFIVNAGGDLTVGLTHNYTNDGYKIGIRDPRRNNINYVINLNSNESAFTSGDYERYFDADDERYHHLLSPLTGSPATGTRSLTVIHDDPVLADASATALFIMGKDNWKHIAETLGVTLALRIDADGSIDMTEAMHARVEELSYE